VNAPANVAFVTGVVTPLPLVGTNSEATTLIVSGKLTEPFASVAVHRPPTFAETFDPVRVNVPLSDGQLIDVPRLEPFAEADSGPELPLALSHVVLPEALTTRVPAKVFPLLFRTPVADPEKEKESAEQPLAVAGGTPGESETVPEMVPPPQATTKAATGTSTRTREGHRIGLPPTPSSPPPRAG
jgi:hypothetical protein